MDLFFNTLYDGSREQVATFQCLLSLGDLALFLAPDFLYLFWRQRPIAPARTCVSSRISYFPALISHDDALLLFYQYHSDL